jgi:hypothetical protein
MRADRISLPCDLLSPRVARRFVTHALHGHHPDAVVDAAELLVSEVVTRVVVLGCQALTVKIDDAQRVTLTITYALTDEAHGDRVPGPVAPRLARRSTRIDLDARTICHEFVLDDESVSALA